jgi:hypothetical protein
MRILIAMLVVESVIGAASAALKPIETDIHPVDNKAMAVYKTTPQGDLRINVYFPPNWKASDRRPSIVFFLAAVARPAVPHSLRPRRSILPRAAYWRPHPSTGLKASITRRRSAASRMARAPSAGSE